MEKAEFIALCKKHNAQTIFKNHVEKTPVGAYWHSEEWDIPNDEDASPVVFESDFISDNVSGSGAFVIRAYAPESWFPVKNSYMNEPF